MINTVSRAPLRDERGIDGRGADGLALLDLPHQPFRRAIVRPRPRLAPRNPPYPLARARGNGIEAYDLRDHQR